MMAAEILDPVRYPPPMPEVIVIDTGQAVLDLGLGVAALSHVGAGLMLDWAPTPELGGTLLTMAAGGSERLTTVVCRATLRNTILALQSIDAQLDELGR